MSDYEQQDFFDDETEQPEAPRSVGEALQRVVEEHTASPGVEPWGAGDITGDDFASAGPWEAEPEPEGQVTEPEAMLEQLRAMEPGELERFIGGLDEAATNELARLVLQDHAARVVGEQLTQIENQQNWIDESRAQRMERQRAESEQQQIQDGVEARQALAARARAEGMRGELDTEKLFATASEIFQARLREYREAGLDAAQAMAAANEEGYADHALDTAVRWSLYRGLADPILARFGRR